MKSIVVEKIAHLLEEVTRIYEDDTNFKETVSKYGDSIIRIHWMYADNARKNQTLKRVCIWPNGDEGYVSLTNDSDDH